MKKALIILFVVLVVVAAGMYAGYTYMTSPVGNSKETVIVEVTPGMSVSTMGAMLERMYLIRSAKGFEIKYRLMDPGYLKVGEYAISESMSIEDIINILVSGRSITIRVTIPEGYTIKQMAEVFETNNIASADEFLQLANNPTEDILADFPYDTAGNLEGFLFPDTYEFAKNTGAAKVIKTMLKEFEKRMGALLDKESTLIERELVILASIVEKEAMMADERPRIAQVFLNRLKIGMKLQSCATVQYLLPKPKENLTLKDLEINSPYNTYLISGLPPAPICSPGYYSLLACVEPSKEGYLYFVATSSGRHIFSYNYSDHLKAASSPDSIEPR